MERKNSFKKNDRAIEAILKGVITDGKLIVEHEKEEAFSVGEIEWIT